MKEVSNLKTLTTSLLLGLYALWGFGIVCIAIVFNSQDSIYILPILVILFVISIVIVLLIRKRKQIEDDSIAYTHFAESTAKDKAQELLILRQDYVLTANLKHKAMHVFWLALMLGIFTLAAYISEQWYIKPIMLTLATLILFLVSPYTIALMLHPILRVNNKGITHFFGSKLIPWEYIAGIAIKTIMVNSSKRFVLQIDLTNIDHFKSNVQHKSWALDKYNYLNLALPTDQLNANIAAEYTKAYAKKANAPLIESKREQVSKLLDEDKNTNDPNKSHRIFKEVMKLEREIDRHLALKLK